MQVKALKTLFNDRIGKEKPNLEETNDDIIIGQKYRAYAKAKDLLNKIFNDLDEFDDAQLKTSKFNKEV